MKNFIMLTDIDGRKFGISVSLIKYWAKDGVVSRIYLEDFRPEATNFRMVQESVEKIAEKITKATEEKAEFVRFLFTRDDKQVCVKASEIRYIKEGKNKWTKVFIEGMGEIEVYGEFATIVKELNAATIYVS